MHKTMLVIGIATVALLCAGGTHQLLNEKVTDSLPEYETPDVTQYEKIADIITDTGLFLFHDRRNAKVCYIYVGYNSRSGLSCVEENRNAENVSHRMAPDDVVVRDDR